jgi:APA family basic amino acid/polyamine antiporter
MNTPSTHASASSDGNDPVALRRVVTLPWLILYGLGSTVGAGIYVLTGVVAGRAGMQAPVSFLIAAVLALFTAMSFAELSARFPRAGGALIYVREGFGWAWLSVVVGLLTTTAGIVSAATVSLGFVGYFAEISSLPSWMVLVLAVFGVGAIAVWGVRESVVVAGVVTVIEVAGLLAILFYGAHYLGEWPEQRVDALLPIGLESSAWMAVASSAVLCFYAFLGFEDIVNVAEEVRDVRRVLPRAILWTLGLSTALYVGVSAVSVLVVDPAELASVDAPLALVFERSGGRGELLSLVALVAMLNGSLVQIVMASRILYSLSREGPLPAWIGWIHPRTRTPIFATLGVTTAVALLAASFPLARLAAATASIALVVFTLVNLALFLIRLRERRAGQESKGRTPLWVPAIGALVSAGFLVLEFASKLSSGFSG